MTYELDLASEQSHAPHYLPPNARVRVKIGLHRDKLGTIKRRMPFAGRNLYIVEVDGALLDSSYWDHEIEEITDGTTTQNA